jgi:DNA-binding transcriptional ArsR family regulator
MRHSRRSAAAAARAPTHRTLTSEREVGAYLHRTRLSILAALRAGPATVSQIAARLGVHPANLTRHVRLLESATLIVLVEKRDTGRNLEKYYRAAARSFDVAPDADALTAPHKIALAMARSELSAALARLPEKSPGAVQVFSIGARLLPQRRREFLAALARLAATFESADKSGGEAYRLTLALFPGQDEDPQDTTRVVLSPKANTDAQSDNLKSESSRSRSRRLGQRRARTE